MQRMAAFSRASASVVFALVALTPATALAQETEPADQVVLSGTVTVPRGKEAGEIVVFHGTVTVAGVALGDVVVLDGRITVSGQVSGSVVNLGGPVALGPDAQVRGSVMASGEVRRAEGAQVGGSVREGLSVTLAGPLEALGRLVVWLAIALSTLALGFALPLAAPRAVDAVHGAATTGALASVGWGFGALVGLPLLAVLLVASVLGLPLGLALLFALGLVFLAGYALSAWILGRLIWTPPRNRPVALLIGWAILAAVLAMPAIGAATWPFVAAFGLGATTVATWRARGRRGRHRARAPVPARYIAEEPMEEEGVGL
jgi:cytoskeletal protein CcmA (bactofilin family)